MKCSAPSAIVAVACLGVMVLAPTTWAADWPQWGGTSNKNMAADEKGLPDSFVPGEKNSSYRHYPTGNHQERALGPQGVHDHVLDARGGCGQGVPLWRGRKQGRGRRLPG